MYSKLFLQELVAIARQSQDSPSIAGVVGHDHVYKVMVQADVHSQVVHHVRGQNFVGSSLAQDATGGRGVQDD